MSLTAICCNCKRPIDMDEARDLLDTIADRVDSHGVMCLTEGEQLVYQEELCLSCYSLLS